jgi:hypothetical protein
MGYIFTDADELREVGDDYLAERVAFYAKQTEQHADEAARYAEGVQVVQAEIDRRNNGERASESFVTEAIWNDNVTVGYTDEGQAVIYTGYYDKEKVDA